MTVADSRVKYVTYGFLSKVANGSPLRRAQMYSVSKRGGAREVRRVRVIIDWAAAVYGVHRIVSPCCRRHRENWAGGRRTKHLTVSTLL